MTWEERVRIYLGRVGVSEPAFVALARQAGHPDAQHLEDLPQLPGDPFDLYYSVDEIATRLQFSPQTIRRRIRAGEFGPAAFIVRDGDDLRVPWSGVAHYLRTHASAGEQWIEARLARLRPIESSGPVFSPIAARTPGEVKRKAEAQE